MHFFLVQPDFKKQKCKIEESIINAANEKHYIVMHYPKYYCELNYLEYF